MSADPPTLPSVVPPVMSKTESMLRVTAAYVVAIGVGLAWLAWGPDLGHGWLDLLVADLLATLVIFGASRMHHNSSFYDAYWSVIPPLVALAWWLDRVDGADAGRCLLVAIVMVVWAVRLTWNWAHGFPGLHHEDWRYPLLRERAGRFEVVVDLMAIHVIPTLQVFLALVPVYVVTRHDRGIGALDVVAFAVGLGAVALETVADLQMHRFARTKRPGQVMDQGLWSWSRHPNYVGEFGFWLSLALFGVAASPSDAWWLFAGSLAMLAMFFGASIPMMEERSLERRPEYQQVIDRVSRFVPRPPRAPRAAR